MPSSGSRQKQQSAKIDHQTIKIEWPLFQPLIPPSSLELVDVFPGQIVTISNFWTKELCKKYVTFLGSLPLVTTPGKPKKGEAVRVNDRFAIEDAAFAERLWSATALKELLSGHEETYAESTDGISVPSRTEVWGGEICGLNSNIRIYRYKKGQFFDQHYDESNKVEVPDKSTGQLTKARTTWTLLLYLTSSDQGTVGGETVFYPERSRKNDPQPKPIVTTLETGMLLLHKHGDDCLLHEGREVTEGEKWVIRTDLCVKR